MTKQDTKNFSAAYNITRAVQAANGQKYIRLESADSGLWFSLADLASAKDQIFAEINRAGMVLLTHSEKNLLLKKIQGISEYEPALVASQPGWVGEAGIYVHPNGEIQPSKNNRPEIIVTFQPDPAYSKRGKLKHWRKRVKPFATNQPIVSFLLAFGFAAPLARFVEPSIPNLALELVGRREAGKTTLATLVGSIFGGDPNSDIGVGRTANLTKHSFKPLQRGTCDSLLVLDETNLIDKAVAEDMNLFFEHTSRDERARYGATQRAEPVRNCLLMTGNTPLDQCTKVATEKREAARSRYIRINLAGSVFRDLPQGFQSSHEALGSMRRLTNSQFGSASRAFVAEIIKAREVDAEAFSAELKKYMQWFDDAVPDQDRKYNRLVQSCALVCAAGRLAEEWGILPIERPTWRRFCLSVLAESTSQSDPEIDRITTLISDNMDRIIQCLDDGEPAKVLSETTLGFCISQADGGGDYFFLQEPLKQLLGSKALAYLRVLRSKGILMAEKGKLVSYAPTALGLGKQRGFRINLSEVQES